MRRAARPVRFPVLALAAIPVVVAACSSGSPGGATSGGGGAQAAAPQALCQQLNGVLSDGPDPDADPVGYALSQIMPLGQIHSGDRAVMATVARLVTADRAVVASNGDDRAATATVKDAYESLNRACPGVAP
jgi:hypothetical protein